MAYMYFKLSCLMNIYSAHQTFVYLYTVIIIRSLTEANNKVYGRCDAKPDPLAIFT